MDIYTLGGRIALAVNACKERTKKSIADEIGIEQNGLQAWFRPTFKKPRDWNQVRHLALFTRTSYEWLLTGKGARELGEIEEQALHTVLESAKGRSSAPTQAGKTLSESLEEEKLIRAFQLMVMVATDITIRNHITETSCLRLAIHFLTARGWSDFEPRDVREFLEQRLPHD